MEFCRELFGWFSWWQCCFILDRPLYSLVYPQAQLGSIYCFPVAQPRTLFWGGVSSILRNSVKDNHASLHHPHCWAWTGIHGLTHAKYTFFHWSIFPVRQLCLTLVLFWSHTTAGPLCYLNSLESHTPQVVPLSLASNSCMILLRSGTIDMSHHVPGLNQRTRHLHSRLKWNDSDLPTHLKS